MPALKNPDPFVLRHTVFPLLALTRVDSDTPRMIGDPRELGSAFFISRDGLFLTAKHVVNEFEANAYSVIALNIRQRARKFCRVTALALHPTLDVAIGRAEQPNEEDGWPFPVRLGSSRVGVGASVLVYGYANTEVIVIDSDADKSLGLDFRPAVHQARVEDYMADGAPFIPAPCYVLSGDPGGGVSGSPVIRKRTGAVHAVVCRGNTTEGGDSYTIALAVGAFVDHWSIPFLGERTIREYAALGVVALR